MSLSGKTIIITGASSGIGAAAARIFHANGANLVLAARRADKLSNVLNSLPDGPDGARISAGDVQDEDFNKSLVEIARAEFGGLDGAFNNAGTLGDIGPVPDMSLANWNEVISVNLTSGFLAAKHQIPAMKETGGGSIVFTSSFVGHTIGLPGMAAYAASKAGLIGLMQVLATEHGPDGIRINALLPGGTKTDMAGSDPAYHEFVAGLHALKRMAEPEEIAATARFLLSDEASFATGNAMLCDGGNSINKT